MAEKRTDIISAIITKCNLASVAGGFYNNLSGKVYEWRADEAASDESISVAVQDTDNENANEGTGSGYQKIYNSLDVHFIITADSAPLARSVIYDLKKVCSQNPNWGIERVQNIYVSDHIRDAQQAEQRTVSGELIIKILYDTLEWES